MKKTLILKKDEEKIVEITTVEERKIDMTEGVGEEHIYESLKKRARKRKPPLWLILTYKNKLKNCMRGKHVRKRLL